MCTNVRIGNRVGVNHTSNHEGGTTNRVPIIRAPLEKIDNRFFRNLAHTLHAARQFGCIHLQYSHRCVIRLPHFWISRIRKIDRVALAQVRRANGTVDENRNSPARSYAKPECCSTYSYFGQVSPHYVDGENAALMTFAITTSERRI